MIVNGNLIGFAMLIVSALVFVLPAYLLKLPNAPVMIGVGILLIALDLAVRLTVRGKERWLMGNRTGGYLFFIPVWIFGITVIIINVVNALFIKK